MSAGDQPRTVTTRYVWIPHGGSGGWLLVHRSVAGGGAGAEEFWLTGEITPEDATDVLKDSAEGWRPMVLGEPVNFLLWPYVLTAVSGRQLRKVRDQVLLTAVRPLADIRVQVLDTPDGPEVAAPALVTLADDPYAPLDADLHLGDGWEAGILDPARRREVLLAALERRLGPGAPHRPPPVHVNRFVADAGGSRSRLTDVLARRAVRSAMAALLADPAGEEPRERLLDELHGHGWSFTAAPLTLHDVPKPAFLDRLCLFLVRTAEGDAGYRLATLPAAADLLRDDDDLTEELAAYLAPLDPALRPRDTTFLEALPAAWNLPRERHALLAPPAWDEVTVLPATGIVPIGTPPFEDTENGEPPRIPGADDKPVAAGPRRSNGDATADPATSEKVDIRHVELFDSQGLPSGKFDLPTIPRQNDGDHTARLR